MIELKMASPQVCALHARILAESAIKTLVSIQKEQIPIAHAIEVFAVQANDTSCPPIARVVAKVIIRAFIEHCLKGVSDDTFMDEIQPAIRRTAQNLAERLNHE